jgi:hypothetical protein
MKDYGDYSIKELKHKIKKAKINKPVFTAVAALSLFSGIICSVLGVMAPFVVASFLVTILSTIAVYGCDYVTQKSQEALDKTSVEDLPEDEFKVEVKDKSTINVKEDVSNLKEQDKNL